MVFFFYPLDFTFVCPTEILAFNDRVEEFRKLGAEVREDFKYYFADFVRKGGGGVPPLRTKSAK